MKKFFTVSGIMILLLILDCSVMPFISINGYYPSLLLIFSIYFSLISGTEEAIIIGAMSGIMQDVYFTGVLGVNGFSNLIVCLLAAQIGKAIFKEKYLIPIVCNFILSLLKGLIIFGIAFFIKESITLNSVVCISLYNFVIGLFMYKFIYKLSEKTFMKNYWKY